MTDIIFQLEIVQEMTNAKLWLLKYCYDAYFLVQIRFQRAHDWSNGEPASLKAPRAFANRYEMTMEDCTTSEFGLDATAIVGCGISLFFCTISIVAFIFFRWWILLFTNFPFSLARLEYILRKVMRVTLVEVRPGMYIFISQSTLIRTRSFSKAFARQSNDHCLKIRLRWQAGYGGSSKWHFEYYEICGKHTWFLIDMVRDSLARKYRVLNMRKTVKFSFFRGDPT